MHATPESNCLLLVHAAHVFPFFGVHSDDFSLLEEGRYRNHRARVEGGGLVLALGVATWGVALSNFELQRRGKSHADDFAVPLQHLPAICARLKILKNALILGFSPSTVYNSKMILFIVQ